MGASQTGVLNQAGLPGLGRVKLSGSLQRIPPIPTVTATPTATATTTRTATPTVTPSPTATPPPDPAVVAPAINQTVATDVEEATSFLYSGNEPIQTGLVAGTIDRQRAAVLRGTVLDGRTGGAAPGTIISVLDHPEYGQTLARNDGKFDLAVNGGGTLIVKYTRPDRDLLPAQRQVEVPWQAYVTLPDVVLIALDENKTQIPLPATGALVARGSIITDDDGSRQATVWLPPLTTATMTRADGSTQELSTIGVRATEYTVGAQGPAKMPAEHPSNSGYTYAVELSADEAIDVDARSVSFSQPVSFYLENFLGFPVGGKVPAGYYDRLQGRWIATPNGVVLKILGVRVRAKVS